ncbi:MAG: sulfatase [Gemmatimonadaceae bacterium]
MDVRLRGRDIWISAAWFALVAGLAEVVVLAIRQQALGQAIGLSRHFVWMTPLGNLLLYAVPASGLSLLAWRWPMLVTLPRVTGVFTFLGALGLLFMYPRLHRLAMLVLAAGVAIQVARIVAAHPSGFRKLAARTTVWIAVLITAMGSAVGGTRWWSEREALASLPPADALAPNVLLIILDTVRAASMSLYGYERPTTPNLERIAKRGVVFDNAVSTAPWTLPSHVSMFTGRYPHEFSANWRVPFDDTTRTLAEVLGARGYLTAGFAANTFYADYEHGLDRGFTHYEDYRITPGQVMNSASLGSLIFAGRAGFSSNIFRRIIDNYEYLGRKKAPHVNADFLAWLDRKEDRPYFAFLNYIDAHWPYTPTADFKRAFGVTAPPKGLSRRRKEERNLRPEERKSGYNVKAYDATIAYLDHHLGVLFDELERRGALKNTLLIIASDHGELLGEHGLFAHANSLYMPLLHVPLVMSFPGRVPAGGRIAEPVTLRSLPATALDFTGASDAEIPGHSLTGHWNGAPTSADPLLSEVRRGINPSKHHPIAKGDMRSVITDGMHYIHNGDGREELYDLRNDPDELSDLVPAGRNATVLERARAIAKYATHISDRTDRGSAVRRQTPLATAADSSRTGRPY